MTPLTAEQAALLDAPHVVHAVDAAGTYVGLVGLTSDLVRVSGPPPGEHWHWVAGAWVLDAVIAMSNDEAFSQFWVLADNTVVSLTAPEMIEVGKACAALVTGLWESSQAVRGQIDAAATAEEVAVVYWP